MTIKFISTISITGGLIAAAFGGWDRFLQTLLLFMVIDWVTGGILLPVVFGKSPNSKNGALESRAGWKDLCRKAMTLFYVLVGAQLDALMGTEYMRDAVCIGFIANEALSIIENAALMGLPMPEALRRGIDILKAENNTNTGKEGYDDVNCRDISVKIHEYYPQKDRLHLSQHFFTFFEIIIIHGLHSS